MIEMGGGGGGGGCNRMYCIHVPGHDPLIFSFLSFSFLIGWVFLWPQLSKVLQGIDRSLFRADIAQSPL